MMEEARRVIDSSFKTDTPTGLGRANTCKGSRNCTTSFLISLLFTVLCLPLALWPLFGPSVRNILLYPVVIKLWSVSFD